MYNLKGFIRISDLVNNNAGDVSLLGEISPIGLSYTKEKGYYTEVGIEGIELVAMSGKVTILDVTSVAPVPDEVKQIAIEVGKWAYDNSTNSGILGEVSGAYPDYLDALNTYFTDTPYADFEFADLTIGDMVTLVIPAETDKMIPEWISFSAVYDEGLDEFPCTVKIWFSDTAFRNQFDEYEIEVVPPLDDIDDFFNTYSTVLGLINAYTRPLQQQKIAEAIDIYPPTIVKTYMFDWYDGEDPPTTIETPWSVVIYGLAGNNYDLILAAIRQYIADNSSHTEEEWLVLFPDIFNVTEFTITPMWNRYAIPNMTLSAGVYSPMVNSGQDFATVLATVPTYDEPHVTLHLMSGVFSYKSLAFYAVGSPNNRDDLFDFDDVFPDYIAVGTDSLDFGKMSPETQGWVTFMTDMLLIAEEMTESSNIPFTCTRIFRTGVMYIAASYNDIQYLITAKKYFEDEVPPPTEI